MASNSTTSDITSATAEFSSPLINLAPELHNKIYRLALVDPETAVSVSGPSFATSTALLRTCTLIRNEATSIFYCENNFHIELDGEADNLHAATRWIERLATNGFLVPKLVFEIKMSNAGAETVMEEYRANIWAGCGVSSLVVANQFGRRDVEECLAALSKAAVAIGQVEVVQSEQQDLIGQTYEARVRKALVRWCESVLSNVTIARVAQEAAAS